MARYRAEIEGNRGRASRLGTRMSGIWTHIRGWGVGVRVDGGPQVRTPEEPKREECDTFHVYATNGSNGGFRGQIDVPIATLKENPDGSIDVTVRTSATDLRSSVTWRAVV